MKPVNLLLVDDRPDGLIALDAVLRCPRYQLFSASSGQEALAHVFDRDFAVVILDVQMPGMDGFETAKVIRQRERSKATPILFVTAINKDPAHVNKGYELGAVDYLFKPFDPVVLQSKVSVFADLWEANRELQDQTEKLRHSEERNTLLLETAKDIVATCDTVGNITSLNSAFERILGFPREAWKGKPFEQLVHWAEQAEVSRYFKAALEEARTTMSENKFQNSAGSYIQLEYSVTPLIEKGIKVGALIVGRDVTERKRVEREKQQRYELERSNKELEQFAFICSHDLQEPLRSMIAFTQILERKLTGHLDAESTEYFNYIVSSSKRMAELIRQILELSLVGRNRTVQLIDLEDVLRDAKNNLNTTLRETGAEIKSDGLPKVNGVHTELVRLFQNLIGNALKFRADRPPRIEIGAAQQGDDWVFSVKDNGIGFDMEYAKQIFLIFKRLHRQEEYHGAGMGLTICQRIVELHGGKIWAESIPNIGTTFFFTLAA